MGIISNKLISEKIIGVIKDEIKVLLLALPEDTKLSDSKTKERLLISKGLITGENK